MEMKAPSDLTVEQMEKLPRKRLKAYKNKLLDYRRSIDQSDVESIIWAKNKISKVQDILNAK